MLIVDDDPLVVRMLKMTFDLEGYKVTTASDGEEGLRRAREEMPDVILCDIMMPNLSGVELHEQMATVAPLLQERMVFLTGGAFTDRARAFLDRIPNRRLDKPFDLKELRRLVGAAQKDP